MAGGMVLENIWTYEASDKRDVEDGDLRTGAGANGWWRVASSNITSSNIMKATRANEQIDALLALLKS